MLKSLLEKLFKIHFHQWQTTTSHVNFCMSIKHKHEVVHSGWAEFRVCKTCEHRQYRTAYLSPQGTIRSAWREMDNYSKRQLARYREVSKN